MADGGIGEAAVAAGGKGAADAGAAAATDLGVAAADAGTAAVATDAGLGAVDAGVAAADAGTAAATDLGAAATDAGTAAAATDAGASAIAPDVLAAAPAADAGAGITQALDATGGTLNNAGAAELMGTTIADGADPLATNGASPSLAPEDAAAGLGTSNLLRMAGLGASLAGLAKGATTLSSTPSSGYSLTATPSSGNGSVVPNSGIYAQATSTKLPNDLIAPTLNDPNSAFAQAAAAQAIQRRLAKGVAATLLTGGQGSGVGNTTSHVLLGS